MKKTQKQRGALLVELAFTLPLLLIVSFNIIDWGVYMYNAACATNAVREATRWQVAILNNNGLYPSTTGSCATATGGAVKVACDYLNKTLINPASTSTISITVTSNTNLNVTTALKMPFISLGPNFSSLFGEKYINASSTMYYE